MYCTISSNDSRTFGRDNLAEFIRHGWLIQRSVHCVSVADIDELISYKVVPRTQPLLASDSGVFFLSFVLSSSILPV